MKKLLIAATLICLASISALGQHDQKDHQNNRSLSKADTINNTNVSQLLIHYYGIKDALVAGDPNLASTKAGEFAKTANGIDYKIISEGNITALLKDAGKISETKDIKQQRLYFANFSDNMFVLAKTINLSSQPIYQAYCPMKKAYWLSNEKAIKNPYFGNTMLTCGSVAQTLE